MKNYIRCITSDGSIVASAVDSTEIVARAEQIHKTSAVVTAALGRTLTAASLMGAALKGEEDTLTIRINGGGPAGTILAVTDSRGNVRGYAQNPVVEIPLNSKGKLDVAGAVGVDGTLSVARDIGGREPYVGQCPLVSGEIAEDITGYYATSEQIPTICALGVLVNPDLTVQVAGGLLVQLLPFADSAAVDLLERNAKALPSVTQMLSSGMTPEDMCRKVLDGMKVEVLDQWDTHYQCNCSLERVKRALSTLRKDELLSLADENGKAEISCHFCDQVYTLTRPELEKLAEEAK
ncbi:Hsp33 family molecular chaperone HslO [Solibaculum mannosilyticum]|uniref:Hsp33 family molecular chaperone HslO n=1 Tax=Solibaculum mannosilyticum TaxID=2780922 RepID=UPI0034B66235